MSLPPVLEDLLAAVEKRDANSLGDCFTEDASYATAVPLPALVGRGAIVTMFSGLFSQVASARFEIVGYTVDGDRVWTERIDHFTFGDRPVSIEVMGVFELAGGKMGDREVVRGQQRQRDGDGHGGGQPPERRAGLDHLPCVSGDGEAELCRHVPEQHPRGDAAHRADGDAGVGEGEEDHEEEQRAETDPECETRIAWRRG